MGVFKRNGNFWIDYYDADGRRHRKMIGPQKTVAQLALKDVKVRISKGEYLGIYEEKKVLFLDFAEKTHIPYAKTNLSPKTFSRCKGILDSHLIPYFDTYLYKISRKSIEEYKQRRSEEVEPGTVNREFSRLRHLFKCAVDWGYIRSNPCKGVKELKEPPGRIRFLSAKEIQTVLNGCDPQSLKKTPLMQDGLCQSSLTSILSPSFKLPSIPA
jgi:integrase